MARGRFLHAPHLYHLPAAVCEWREEASVIHNDQSLTRTEMGLVVLQLLPLKRTVSYIFMTFKEVICSIESEGRVGLSKPKEKILFCWN